MANTKSLKLNSIRLNPNGGRNYREGKFSYDKIKKTGLCDTGYKNVRVRIGQNIYVPFFNDTGADFANGDALCAVGVDATNEVVKAVKADASLLATADNMIGVCKGAVVDGQPGLALWIGQLDEYDTSSFTVDDTVYLSETAAALTATKPSYPALAIEMGTVEEVNASYGKIFIKVDRIRREQVVKDYSFTNNGVDSTPDYVGGFYEWVTTKVTLTQGSLTQTLGTANASKAARVGVVFGDAGTVDAGTVGLKVTGTIENDEGIQVAAQDEVLTTDIASMATDDFLETTAKFSGTVTLTLYDSVDGIGTPSTFTVDLNYGLSRVDDMDGKDFTFSALSASWLGGADEATFDIIAIHHKSAGWTYAASGFVPGSGDIIKRLTDHATDGLIKDGEYGGYDRNSIDTLILGSSREGVIIKVVTDSVDSIHMLNINTKAFIESLT